MEHHPFLYKSRKQHSLTENDKAMNAPISQLKVGLTLLVASLVFGTIGYMLLEQWSLPDAIYMTVISITTTGFKEVQPLSDAGRVFTLFLIVMGVGSIAYTGGRAVQFLLENQLVRRRSMDRKISELRNHSIVCGYGKMGRYVCDVLRERQVPFVVIESDQTKSEEMVEHGYLCVTGDATNDETLEQAGIAHARGLVAVLESDADNVFTTLSAKSLNPQIFVVARAVEEETAPKLVKAGANRVVKPYETAGTKMAELLLRPGVIEFMDIVARDLTVDLNLEEVSVGTRSPLVGKALAESPIRQDLNIIVVMVTKRDGSSNYNPKSSTRIEAGDRLIALGERSNLEKLTRLCAGE
jgi:voltage-gated potassium channel